MADAAYLIFCKDGKTHTGNFYIDDNLIKEAGIKELEKYGTKVEILHVNGPFGLMKKA